MIYFKKRGRVLGAEVLLCREALAHISQEALLGTCFTGGLT